MGFNLNEYEPVEERLAKFISDYPDFRIDTELESMADNRFIVKAYLYRTWADAVAFSTGLAEEKVTDRGVNSTSALENCETSAIGRALANAGYAPKGKRASREEMAKVSRSDNNDWERFVNAETKPAAKEEPVTLEDAQQTLIAALGATQMESAPSCTHGEMVLKEGTGKTGKPYHGYTCPRGGNSVCKPIWYNLTKDGTWVLQEPREK